MNKLQLSFEYRVPSPTRNCACVPDAGLQKKAILSTLIVGPYRTGDGTQATCILGSGASRSFIHYDFIKGLFRSDFFSVSDLV
jgi:hypothetical protein